MSGPASPILRMSNDARPDPIVVDDVVLIKEALSGDGEAFAVLVDRHKNTIFNLCYRMMGNYQDAQDISQEAFLQVWRKLSWFRAGQKFRNWLITIAINLCRNKLKRDKIIRFISIDRTVRTEDGEIPVEVADATPTPEQLALGKEWKKRINLMVSSLSVKYRPVFLLRYVEGLSYKEISEITGMPAGTVETYLFRAKKTILKKIEIFFPG